MSNDKDIQIRNVLRAANKKGKLDVVAAVTGISASELRKIMNSKGELTLMTRAMLGVHLTS